MINWNPEYLRIGTPGSDKAISNGCKCPKIDNAQGAGLGGNGMSNGFVVNLDCPVHGEEAQK